MPLPPDLTFVNWPDLTNTTLYPPLAPAAGGVAHAPLTTPIPSITKSCFPQVSGSPRPLVSVLPFAHTTEVPARVSPTALSVKIQLPPPPSVSVHCPTIRTATTLGTSFVTAATATSTVAVDVGDACLPIINNNFNFPCTTVTAAGTITLVPSTSAPSFAVTPTTSTTGNTCSTNLNFNLQIPSAGCPVIKLTPTATTMEPVTPSNGSQVGGVLTITDQGNVGPGPCSPGFKFNLDLSPCAPQFVPGQITVSEVDNPTTDGPVGGSMTVVVMGEACERTIQHNMDVRIPARSNGGGKIGIGTVLGGNAYPISGALDGTEAKDDGSYPSTRPLSLPLPLTDQSGAPILLPVVSDWGLFTLTDTFKIGDQLPRLPWGLCYVKLERPYSFGTASWLSAFTKAPAAPAAGNQKGIRPTATYVKAATTTSSSFTVTWSRPVLLAVSQDQIKGKVKITGATSKSISVLSVTVSGNLMTVVLSGPLSHKTDPGAQISFAAALVKSNDGLDTPPVFNAAISMPITFTGVSASIIIVLNRAAQQAFRYGDYVLMDLQGVNVSDTTGVNLLVPEILAPAAGSVPTHTHAAYSGGLQGGGPLLG